MGHPSPSSPKPIDRRRSVVRALLWALAAVAAWGAAAPAPLLAQQYDPSILLNAECRQEAASGCLCTSSVESVLPLEEMAFLVRLYARSNDWWLTRSQSWFDAAAAEAMIQRLEESCGIAASPAPRPWPTSAHPSLSPEEAMAAAYP